MPWLPLLLLVLVLVLALVLVLVLVLMLMLVLLLVLAPRPRRNAAMLKQRSCRRPQPPPKPVARPPPKPVARPPRPRTQQHWARRRLHERAPLLVPWRRLLSATQQRPREATPELLATPL